MTLKFPNAFQVEGVLTPLNYTAVRSIRCPHCHQLGSMHPAQPQSVSYNKAITGPLPTVSQLYGVIRICPNPPCRGLVFMIEDYAGEILEIEPPELIDFVADNLPEICEKTLKEAVACHAAGAYRGATMMVRRLLEEICELNGAAGETLHKRLESLKTKISLPQELFEAMTELKALGNDAAHIEAKAYENIGYEEAADSIELAKEILKSLYQLKSLVERLQGRKKNQKND